MDQELQEKTQKLDASIQLQFDLYEKLRLIEKWTHDDWSFDGKRREKDIYQTIADLQAAKIRLINNEKLPETVYVDREVVKYKDRIVKRVVVHKSGLANAFMWFSLLIYFVLYILYHYNYLHIFFVLK